MTLRADVLNAVIDGRLGKGLVVTRQAVIQLFSDVPETYTGVILSNSEMTTGVSSPTYDHFTQRVGVGTYRIHPQALLGRMAERGLA
ncbi:hypothetical protein [Pseudomonas fluorescens]|uniref:Uncharacterized protein n=1 Tax=Pseudomonas fluorescens TaxID=294 RepID=A0A5E7FMM2_PSEFL|nr:hypothetical protein [Pseudomonas fluorescens]VVO40536.1 hypothetical protein PS833_05778 [Pseudomonas fluorescens]